MSLWYSIWPPPTWHTPHDFAQFDGLISTSLDAAVVIVSVPSRMMSFAANWRLEGGQYLPNMPVPPIKAGAPQMVLWAAVSVSFLPCELWIPVEAPCAGEVTV